MEHGKVFVPGKKLRRIKWPSEKNTKPCNTGSDSLGKAIEAEMLVFIGIVHRQHLNKRKTQEWELLESLNRLNRLYRKLKKHNLIK